MNPRETRTYKSIRDGLRGMAHYSRQTGKVFSKREMIDIFQRHFKAYNAKDDGFWNILKTIAVLLWEWKGPNRKKLQEQLLGNLEEPT